MWWSLSTEQLTNCWTAQEEKHYIPLEDCAPLVIIVFTLKTFHKVTGLSKDKQ